MDDATRARIRAGLVADGLITDETPEAEAEALIRDIDERATAILAAAGLPDHVCRGLPAPPRRLH